MGIFSSVAHTTMLNGIVDINTTTNTAVRVGDANLSERKLLYIMNASTVPVYIGSETSNGTAITEDLIARHGIKMAAGDAMWLPVGDNITVYARSNSGAGKRLRVCEMA